MTERKSIFSLQICINKLIQENVIYQCYTNDLCDFLAILKLTARSLRENIFERENFISVMYSKESETKDISSLKYKETQWNRVILDIENQQHAITFKNLLIYN